MALWNVMFAGSMRSMTSYSLMVSNGRHRRGRNIGDNKRAKK